MFSQNYFGCVSPNYDNKDTFAIKIEGSGLDNFRKFVRDGHVYYAIPHNTTYKVKMINNSDCRANATLKIDGETMGMWRLEAYSDIMIERPSHNNRKFTFVRESSQQAASGRVLPGNIRNGLVEVTFIPEVKGHDFDRYDMRFNTFSQESLMSSATANSTSRMSIHSDAYTNSNDLYDSYDDGGTVLGDDSSQRFITASSIREDRSRKQTRRVRLVIQKNVQPFVSIKTRGYDFDELYDDPVPPQLKQEQNARNNKFMHTDRYDGAENHYGTEYITSSRTNIPIWESRCKS